MRFAIFETITNSCINDARNVPSGENKYVWHLFIDMMKQQKAIHLPGVYIGLLYDEDDVACGGIVFVVDNNVARIDLVCSLTHGIGLGTLLLKEVEKHILQTFGLRKLIAHPTETSIAFFERNGYTMNGNVMERELQSPGTI